jgi:PAS domain S-box-containing protein
MSEILPTSTPLLPPNLTDLSQAESALKIAWEELEKQIELTINQTTGFSPENARQLSNCFATTKHLCQEFKTQMKQAISRLEFHAENSPMAVIEWDSKCRIIRWSPQAEKMFGWTNAEILGQDWHDLSIIDEAECESVNLIVNKLLAGSETRSVSCNRNYTKDRSIIYCEWYSSALKDAEGKVISVLSFGVDVSDRHRTQEELYRRERDFSTIVENSTDVIARYDRELRHLYLNRAVETATGKPPAEFTGKTNLESGMPVQFCNLFDESITKVFQTGKQETIEFEFLTPKGIKHYHCRVIPEFSAVNSVETVLTIARDFTELKQVELQLRHSEAKFRSIVNSNLIGIFFWDINGNFTDANDFFLNSVNYTREDLLASKISWQTMTPPECRCQDAAFAAELQTKGSVAPTEQEFIRADGSRIPVLLGGTFLEGTQELGVSFVLDISDRKAAEASLKQQKEVLQTIFDSVPVMLTFLDKNREISWVNRCWEKVLGWNHEEIKDRDMLAEFYPDPEYRECVLDFIAAATENWADFKTKVRDGRIIDTTWANVRLSDGGYIGIGQDISDRKQAEAELKELNETLEAQVAQRTAELQTFFDTLPDQIFVVERENMRLSFVNHSLVEFSGFDSRQQMQGKTIFECYSSELAERFYRENLQVFESGKTLHLQEKFARSGGSIYFDTLKIPLRNPDGEVYALIGTSRNITELVEIRQTLSERTIQLEATNKELESFCYSVSHDLRAPLRHISGFVNALKQRLETIDTVQDRKIVHYLEVIEDSSQKMSLLIDGLLMLSRVGRAELMQIPIDLDRLVQNAIKLAKPRTPATDAPISPSVEFEIGNLPVVTGDPTLLQQVFSNLIGNAVKFSRDRDPAKVVIDALPDGTIFVKDNGAGFEMAYADRLFGAFQRLHSQREFEGTGIGLAIVQRIIHRHGGKIWAESAPGCGATFYLRLSQTISASNIEG